MRSASLFLVVIAIGCSEPREAPAAREPKVDLTLSPSYGFEAGGLRLRRARPFYPPVVPSTRTTQCMVIGSPETSSWVSTFVGLFRSQSGARQ